MDWDGNENEILKIDTRLVNLNVRVLDKNLVPVSGLNLKKSDFLVYENGKKQDVAFLSNTDTPFDLVLLLDLSGSTVRKRDVIWESVKRFVEATRPNDPRFSSHTYAVRNFNKARSIHG